MRAVFYTEGGGKYGLGHIVRCGSLAFAMAELGIHVDFVVNGSGIDGFLPPNSYRYDDWKAFCVFGHYDIAVIDSYEADLDTYLKIKNSSGVVVAIDDEIRLEYSADIVLNSTIGAEKWDYPQSGTIYLLGSEYFLMRRDFGVIKPKKIQKQAKKIVIALGGSDALGIAVEISRALIDSFSNMHKTIIVGPGFKDKDSLLGLQNDSFECIVSAGALRLKEIFEDSDLAICAGGQTLYELAAFGIPTVAFWVVKNQIPDIDGFCDIGFLDGSYFYDKHRVIESLKGLADDEFKREKLSKIGQNTVSADGAAAVCEHILKTIEGKK